jgi:transcription initiation factor TFIIIB Brf1 subunit/transcription initiation factor TFIIB
MNASEIVLQTIKKAAKAMKAGEIANAAKIDKKEVDKAIKLLVKENKLHSPVRCFYDVKK